MNLVRLTNARLYVDGWGFSGQCDEVDIPVLKWASMELRNLALHGKVKAPLSLEELRTTIKGSFDPALVALICDPTVFVNLQIRADLTDLGPLGISRGGEVVAFVRGWAEEINPGTVRGQQETQGGQYAFHLMSYRLVAAGTELWDVDLLSGRTVINGNTLFEGE